MGPWSEHRLAAAKAPAILAGLLGIDLSELDVRREVRVRANLIADLVISAVNKVFVIEVKATANAPGVLMATRQVQQYAAAIRRHSVPLVAVPFMGEVGRCICEQEGVGWFDLSGNAHIVAPGIRVIVEGKPNRFKMAGRPPNLFAPKSSRIVRWLLIHAGEHINQREISRATGLDEGFVSRLVARLEKEDYIVRDEHGGVCAKDPALLLDAWRDAYQFSKHTLHQGHVAARSGDVLLRFICDSLAEQKLEHATTGLAAAWALTRFAAFRIVTVYLLTDPSPALIERLGYREDTRGANLWLVVPNDEGVFQGAVEKDGVRCVSPVQVYVDLKDHPERSSEAAVRLRSELLTWRRDG